MSTENVEYCALRQQEILANAARMLKAGGQGVLFDFAPLRRRRMRWPWRHLLQDILNLP